MRLLFIILLFSFQANATTYYVSNSGSDAANGLTTATAWQTIAKVNGFTFASGDVVLFKASGSWDERLNVPASNITFGSYGTGAKPLITGLQTVTGFTNVGNVWTASVPSSVAYLNTVLVNGVIRAKGRTPNTGYLTFSGYSGSPHITQLTTALTGTPDYTGAEIAVRLTDWVIDVNKITNQSTGTLTLSPGLTYDQPYSGTGYFIQNHESTLDLPGEWYFDSTNKILKVYSTTSPVVQISTIDTLINIFEKDNVRFNGLQVTGANKAAFQLDSCNRISIVNTSINNCGSLGISGVNSDSVSIIKDSLQNILSGGIFLKNTDAYDLDVNLCDSSLVDTTYFKNIGHLAGMGMSGDGRYIASYIIGHNGKVSNSRFDSCGYIGVYFNGQNTIIEKNYLTNFCFIKDDGGAIYTFLGGYFASNFDSGSVIKKNIAIGGIGAMAGTAAINNQAAGIFLDNLTENVTIDSNTIADCLTNSLKYNESNTVTATNNTVNNSVGYGMRIQGSALLIGSANTIKHNIFYSPNSSYALFQRDLSYNFGTMDSNYYSRPSNEDDIFLVNSIDYSLSEWVAASGKDAHSLGTPGNRTSDTPLFHYNATLSDSIISLSGWYTDMKGNVYNNSITLTPFTSAILFPIAAPVRLAVKVRRVQNL